MLQKYLCCSSVLLLCLYAAQLSHAATDPTASHYIAGVVEFRPSTRGMPSDQVVANQLQSYLDVLNSTDAQGTDIIVFPEATLNMMVQATFVPDAERGVQPCRHADLPTSERIYADFFIKLSCAAREAKKYVVINLTEKQNCSDQAKVDPRPCARNGLNIFNTNVAFDREGRVVARYRKIHAYVEAVNTTYKPEYVDFETDFGVRFALFTCFDMLFYTPGVEMARTRGITDFIFTSWFFSELPFLTAVQLQQSWAWGNNVNLLAAGASYPISGATGSGIYAGNQGALTAIMADNDGVTQLLKARVPKFGNKIDSAYQSPNATKRPSMKLLQDEELVNFNSTLVDFTIRHAVKQELCMHGLCCQFEVTTMALKAIDPESVFYVYRMGVYKGNRTYERKDYNEVQICAIYACTDATVRSCGLLFDDTELVHSNFYFRTIRISGKFEKTHKAMIMPTTLTTYLYPLIADKVHWRLVEKDRFLNAEISMDTASDHLLTFGIYGNYYDGKSSAANTVWHYMIVVVFFILNFIISN